MTVSEDFTGLTGRFRGELLAHCYRMLGSAGEAEDLVQETYLRAWRSFDGFEGRSSVRTWLYRIATNVCLTAIERRGRRPLPSGLGGPAEDPEAPLVAGPEVPWLQPFPGALLAGEREDPAAVAVSRAGIRLAFVAALQYLSARQRAVLILRDVLEWPAAEVADLLGTTTTAVNSGLRRARAQLAQALPAEDELAEPAEPDRRALLDRFAAAIEDADASALAELLREDVALEMPPLLTWFTGRPGRGALRRVAPSHRARAAPAGSGHGERAAGVRGLPARTRRGISRARRAGAHGHRDGDRADRRASRTRACSGRSACRRSTLPPGRCRRRTQRSLRGPAEQGMGAARISCQLRARRCRAGRSAPPAAPHSVPGLGPGNVAGPCQRLHPGAARGDNRRGRQRQRGAARLPGPGA